MDKIDFTTASLINPQLQSGAKPGTKKPGAGGETKEGRKTIFTKILESAVSQTGDLGPLSEITPSEEALSELMDAVHSAGSDLKDRPFAEEILNYKKAVRNFINYVVENAFSVEKSKTRNRGKTKVQVQVQVIDQKLEELAAAILSGQTTQLKIIAKLDEIKGLLVDLTITGVIRERDE